MRLAADTFAVLTMPGLLEAEEEMSVLDPED